MIMTISYSFQKGNNAVIETFQLKILIDLDNYVSTMQKVKQKDANFRITEILEAMNSDEYIV